MHQISHFVPVSCGFGKIHEKINTNSLKSRPKTREISLYNCRPEKTKFQGHLLSGQIATCALFALSPSILHVFNVWHTINKILYM